MGETANASKTELYLFRHGETRWSISGQHTGHSDIPLTENGRTQAQMLKDLLANISFKAVLVSPLERARDTAKLAGLGDQAIDCPDLIEFNYGDYEGLTTAEIRKNVPGWTLFTHPCPGGETLDEAWKRTRRVIAQAREYDGKVALFAHGHILRILATAWLDIPPENGQHLMLDAASMSILSREHEEPAIKWWNTPAILLKTSVKR